MSNALLLGFAANLEKESNTLAGFAADEYEKAPIGTLPPLPGQAPPPQAAPAMAQHPEPAMPPIATPTMAPPPVATPPQQAVATPPNGGYNTSGMSQPAMSAMENLTTAWGQPLSVTSAYRSPEHNARVGGARRSQHMHGNAFDIDVSHLNNDQRKQLIQTAQQAGFNGVGVYANSLHFDTGGKRAWGPDYSRNSVPDWARDVAFGGPVNTVVSTKSGPNGEPVAVDANGAAAAPQVSKFDKFLERVGLGPAEDPDEEDDEYPMTGRERLGNILETASAGFESLSSGAPMDLSGILRGQAARRQTAMEWLEKRRQRRKEDAEIAQTQATFAEMYPQYAELASTPQGLQLAVRMAELEDQQTHDLELQTAEDVAAEARRAADAAAEAERLATREEGEDRRLERRELGETTRQEAGFEQQTTERVATQFYTNARDVNLNDFDVDRDEATRVHQSFLQNDQQEHATILDTSGKEHDITRDEAARAFEHTERQEREAEADRQANLQVNRDVREEDIIAQREAERARIAANREREIEKEQIRGMAESLRESQIPGAGEIADRIEVMPSLAEANNLYAAMTGTKYEADLEAAEKKVQSNMEAQAVGDAYADRTWGDNAAQLARYNPEAAGRFITQQIEAEVRADEAAAEKESSKEVSSYFDELAAEYAETNPEVAQGISEAARIAEAGDLETASKRFLEVVGDTSDTKNFRLYETLLHSTSPERAATFAEIIGKAAGVEDPAMKAARELQVAEFKATGEKIQNSTMQIEQLAIANELLSSPEFSSGPVSRQLLTPFLALSELGINIADKDTLTSQEVFNSVAEGAIAYMRVPGDIMSDQDVVRYRNSTIGLNKSPEANALTYYALTETTRRREAKYRAELDYFANNHGNMEGSEAYVNDRLEKLGIMEKTSDGKYRAVPMIPVYEAETMPHETIQNMPNNTPYYVKRNGVDVLMIRGKNDVAER